MAAGAAVLLAHASRTRPGSTLQVHSVTRAASVTRDTYEARSRAGTRAVSARQAALTVAGGPAGIQVTGAALANAATGQVLWCVGLNTELGTYFSNFDGMPWPSEYSTWSTPADLIALGRYAMSYPVLSMIVSQVSYSLPDGDGHHGYFWQNTNPLMGVYPGPTTRWARLAVGGRRPSRASIGTKYLTRWAEGPWFSSAGIPHRQIIWIEPQSKILPMEFGGRQHVTLPVGDVAQIPEGPAGPGLLGRSGGILP